MLIRVHPFGALRSSLPGDGAPQRIDDSRGRISRRIDIVIRVGRRDAVKGGVVEAAAVGEDPVYGVVRHLGRAAMFVAVVVVRVARAKGLHARLLALGDHVVANLLQGFQGLAAHAHLGAENRGF